MLTDWFTEALFQRIFPYAEASVVYTTDNKPFWDYKSFIAAIAWMNAHQNPQFHKFGESNASRLTNQYEIAAFLANTCQEVGDPSLKIPYPYWPIKVKKTGVEFNTIGAGGLLCIIEGCCAGISIFPSNQSNPVTKSAIIKTVELSPFTKNLIGLSSADTITSYISDLSTINQPGFGLNGGSSVDLIQSCAVSDDGTLYGKNQNSLPKNSISKTDRHYNALGPYAQYGGRGAIQLSYNFNYTQCSLALFNDLRLVQYPNLLITTDRETFNGHPFIFGFPGPNPRGNNKLPLVISQTTPPARLMAWISAIYFWMTNQSGKTISCHQCMMQPTVYGITSVNMIVNNQSGCTQGTWAANKVAYYQRICNILGIDCTKTIVCPSKL